MYTILLVEDNPADAKIMSFVIERKNYQVLHASEVYQAIEYLNDYKVNLILLDWLLPKISGIELLKTVRAMPKHKLTPVIIVSGKNETKDVQKALQGGASDYIVKPVDPLILNTKLDRLLTESNDWLSVELDTTERASQAAVDLQLIKLSEVSVDIKSPLLFTIGSTFKLTAKVLLDIDLPSVLVKVFSVSDMVDGYCTLKCTLVGMKEVDLQKIRLKIRSNQHLSKEVKAVT